ncbi:MAG: beta-glucosidase, partial [Chloroflexi bacterium]|nr:beta-glucosidase [Chloroflexota bacterium]
TGDVACDHYHRYAEDVQLMAGLGLQAYRFSIAWPRILPQGRGPLNAPGLDFYDRLVDSLCAANVTPFAALYHWDLPQALEEAGGWLNRATADHFAHYTEVVAQRLGDRVKHWATFNEPLCVALLGYYSGEHAPGHRDPTFAETNAALHHVYLAHGQAVPVLRAHSPGCQVGLMLNIYPIYPASDSPADRAAATRFDRLHNEWFSLPPLLGEYPADLLERFGPAAPDVRPGDMALIAAPLDFVGLNYYSRMVVADDPTDPDPMQVRHVRVESSAYTDMDWEIYPDGLRRLLHHVQRRYHPRAIYVAENGCAMPDVPGADGQVHDPGRVAYLHAHLQALHQAIQEGVAVQGYFAWSLLDNFEWAFGYAKRFGLVYVDYPTQRRIPKDSYRFYQDVIRHNALPES